jgi:F420H(2)-dependent quinone reductase
MRDDVREALAVDSFGDRTIDINTAGRRSGEQRRIETVFRRVGDSIYLSGIPGPQPRAWLLNLAAEPHFIFHLKRGVVADLPATATVITDPVERRRILTPIVQDFNRSRAADSPWGEQAVEDWVADSPLAKVSFDESD